MTKNEGPSPCVGLNQIYIKYTGSKTLADPRKGAKTMEENCLCMVVADDDRLLCVKDEKCCEEIAENLEPSEC